MSYKELFLETKKQLQEEKEEFKKQIELLLTKVGKPQTISTIHRTFSSIATATKTSAT